MWGSIQKLGAIIVLEVSAVMTLPTTSFCRQAHLARRPRAVDIQLQCRVVQILGDVDVAHARELADLRGKLHGAVRKLSLQASSDLDINRRGHPEAEDRVHQAARLEVGA